MGKVKKKKKKVRHATHADLLSLRQEVKKLRGELEALRNDLKSQSASAFRAADAALYVAQLGRR